MSIRDSIVFDIAGSLTTSKGQLANFLRGSKAYAEYIIDGGLHLVEVSTHQPRFGNDGSLYLEPGTSNYVREPTNLADTTLWIRGSHINVLPNVSTSMANTYEADRVTVTPGTTNPGRQTLRQDISLPPGPTTFTFYLRLMGGVFGPEDKMRIVNEDDSAVEVSLAEVYNNNPRRYLPVSITTEAEGEGFSQMSMQLYIESTVSFDFGGASASPGLFRTSFVDGLTAAPSRANETLMYEKSPFNGLRSFTAYFTLIEWRGSGLLFSAGNVSVAITETGFLQAVVGSAVITTNNPLSSWENVIVLRANHADNSLKLFLNGTLEAEATLANFTGSQSPFTLTPTGMRRYRSFFVLDKALSDGSPEVGGPADEEVAELITNSNYLLTQTDGRGIISFPSVRILPRARASIRLPQTQYAVGQVAEVVLSEDSKPQITFVNVSWVGSPYQTQIEWVSINGNPPIQVAVQEPTAVKILFALQEKFQDSTLPYPVEAVYTDEGLLITSKQSGNKFTVAASLNLKVSTPQAAEPPVNTMRVGSASDFRPGPARVIRDNLDITDIFIKEIIPERNELRFSSQPTRLARAIQVNDFIFQADWKTNIAPGNYLVGIHETHLNQVVVSDKAIDGFALENNSTQELTVTPFIRVVV